jgi:hypothetical protein
MIMKLRLTFFTLMLFTAINLFAQDAEKPGLTVAGSVDTYYKYDFSGKSQIQSSFIGDQNTVGIGMVDVALSQAVGKASFVGEVAFGPRAEATAPGPVQNLFVSYQFSKLLKITGGFMSTFVGYEVISPTLNFNYSSSYMFYNGPFQNGGVKADLHFSDKISLMIGLFNRFDHYDNVGYSLNLGTQLHVTPVAGMDFYLNVASSDYSGHVYDLTATYQATDRLKIGLNVANRDKGAIFAGDSNTPVDTHYTGVAGYINYKISDPVALGLRYENFSDTDGNITGYGSKVNINAFTLSGNISAGPIRLIPEIRMDIGSQDIFTNSGNNPTNSASQVLVAAVYAF